jgi:hypothetical protein
MACDYSRDQRNIFVTDTSIYHGSKFTLFRYSEYTKMPDGIVNFMIIVIIFRLYTRKYCGTKYRQARVSSCIIYHFIPDFEPLFHFVAKFLFACNTCIF